MKLNWARATAHVRSVARLDSVVSSLSKYRPISHSRLRASAVQSPGVMGRGGQGEEHTVSSASVIDSVGREEEHPIRVNPRSDKFGVKHFHHIEFWVADATAAAKRCVRVYMPRCHPCKRCFTYSLCLGHNFSKYAAAASSTFVS